MATIPADLACPLPPATWWGRLSEKLNTIWHKYSLWVFGAVVLAHWAEHLAQSIQIYVLGWPLPQARGVLGMPFPWLVKSELMHYLYAIVMLVLFWVLRKGFTGRSYVWWMIAFWIQFWHHIEHAVLQGQVIYGQNLFGAPAPISLVQTLGFLEGTAASGFNGLMTGPPKHDFTTLMFFVRRVEVHMFYNTIVFIPMVVAMYLHMFPSPEEEQHMGCSCAWYGKHAGYKKMLAQRV